MSNKQELTPQSAAFILRMVDSLLTTTLQTTEKGNAPEIQAVFGQFHDAVEMACTALIIVGDQANIEIDGGDK